MDPGAPGESIMQNKPNFRNDKMNTTFFLTKDYENEIALGLQKYKPNQSQFQTGHLLIDRSKRIYYYGIW